MRAPQIHITKPWRAPQFLVVFDVYMLFMLFDLSRKASSSKEKDKKSEKSKEKTALNQLPKAEVDHGGSISSFAVMLQQLLHDVACILL